MVDLGAWFSGKHQISGEDGSVELPSTSSAED